MSKTKIHSVIERAIAKADSSYFFEDYGKQAAAVLKAIEAAGFVLTVKEPPHDVYVQASNEMKTGRIKPDDHIKDVWAVMLRLLAPK